MSLTPMVLAEVPAACLPPANFINQISCYRGDAAPDKQFADLGFTKSFQLCARRGTVFNTMLIPRSFACEDR